MPAKESPASAGGADRAGIGSSEFERADGTLLLAITQRRATVWIARRYGVRIRVAAVVADLSGLGERSA